MSLLLGGQNVSLPVELRMKSSGVVMSVSTKLFGHKPCLIVVLLRASLEYLMNWVLTSSHKKHDKSNVIQEDSCAYICSLLYHLVHHFCIWSVEYYQHIMNIIYSLCYIPSPFKNFNHHHNRMHPRKYHHHHQHQKVFWLTYNIISSHTFDFNGRRFYQIDKEERSYEHSTISSAWMDLKWNSVDRTIV